ncbi:MAG: hypothetical protein LKM35_01620 [Lachnospiraceae bacterium]|jgi:hypothetical protein|nr:hypothetical protein [Lachnospiraceae bacterium]MCI1726376.1 hypothetical protein [Lachnospiraceae bacterium]
MSKFLKIIVNLFLVCAILVAVAILVPPLCGITTTIVDTETMDTNLPMGSITYSKDIAVANLVQGNEILKESDAETYAYIIQSGDYTSGKYQVVNAMDRTASSQEITLRNSVSKVIITVPYIGYVIVAMHSMEGIIIIALVVLFMIILFILSELWKKVPEEEDESEEDEKPLTRKEQKARLKAEKEQAKEDARNARLEEKAAKKRGTPVQEADHAADETVGAVQANMAESDRLTGESAEAGKNASIDGTAEETAASVSQFMKEDTKDLPQIDTHAIDTGLIREAAGLKENAAAGSEDAGEAGAAVTAAAAVPAGAEASGDAAGTEKEPESESFASKLQNAFSGREDLSSEPGRESRNASGTQKPAQEPMTQKAAQPSQAQSGALQQNAAQPSPPAQPGAVQQNAAQPSQAQSGAVQQNMAQPSPVQPSASQPGAVQPNAVQPSTVQPDAGEPETDGQPQQEGSAFVPVQRMTLEEILDQAVKSGNPEPPVMKDPVTGTSLVDFSDLL